jgi:uncharacterized protein YndB with AHSA1/START domain
MNNTIQRELTFPQPRDVIWQALTTSEMLAEWMYPNDFEPRVGHHFTFEVPPNPKMNFEGLTVRCEVLECDPPRGSDDHHGGGGRLVFSWTVGGPVVDTRVSFHLLPEANGTKVLFEHAGFDLSQPYADQAFAGAGYGWAKMLKKLGGILVNKSN